ncbi:hypothetical protein Trydic_g2990 [Trypoxylus dichotomus]
MKSMSLWLQSGLFVYRGVPYEPERVQGPPQCPALEPLKFVHMEGSRRLTPAIEDAMYMSSSVHSGVRYDPQVEAFFDLLDNAQRLVGSAVPSEESELTTGHNVPSVSSCSLVSMIRSAILSMTGRKLMGR